MSLLQLPPGVLKCPPGPPERTVHMAAKAFILSAFISLLAHRQMASTHMRRKPMARSPMYMNSLITDSHRTPETEQEKSFDGATGLRSTCFPLWFVSRLPCVSPGVSSMKLRHFSSWSLPKTTNHNNYFHFKKTSSNPPPPPDLIGFLHF